MRSAPPGILCALVTPFDARQSPDTGALGDLIDFQVASGTHGLFVLGTTGEGVLLEADGRREVAEAAVRRAAGRIPVIVHCGAADTRTAADLARHAAASGADGVAVVAPYFFAYAEEELARHFTTVAEAAPEIGHYVYENPERVGYSAGVRLVRRLVTEVPNVRGVKDTGDSIGKLVQYLSPPGDPMEVYTGNNLTILPALAVGARGAVSAVANAAPELVRAVHDAWVEGRLEDARSLQYAVARLQGSLRGMPYVGAIKELLTLRGLPGGGTRAPQPGLIPEQARVLRHRLAEAPDLDRWLQAVGAPGRPR